MQTVLYDGTFEGWLCAVFDQYEYRFEQAHICTEQRFQGNIFEKVHTTCTDQQRCERILKGLKKKLSPFALRQIYWAFLSESEGMENTLLQYVQYAFSSMENMETDFGHPAVLTIAQAAKKVGREKHRMEAFVRFQKTKDELYYSIIEPDFNVLPLIADHFEKRYADQRWLIYDGKRKCGAYFDLQSVAQVQIDFSEEAGQGQAIASIYDEEEDIYQQLWNQYFKSVNIAARKNTRLHIQHMPRRYWKYLPEKRPVQ